MPWAGDVWEAVARHPEEAEAAVARHPEEAEAVVATHPEELEAEAEPMVVEAAEQLLFSAPHVSPSKQPKTMQSSARSVVHRTQLAET